MTGVLNAIRLDHLIVRPRYPTLVLLLAIGVTVGVLSGSALTGIVLVTLVTAPIGGSYFAVYEANRLEYLFGTLPLKRSSAEVGIYTHTMLLVAINGMLAGLLGGAIGAAEGLSVSGGAIAVTFALSFLAACLYMALLFPVYLAVPFSKVNVLTNVPFMVITVVVIFISKRTDWLARLAPVDALYREHPAAGTGLTVLCGLGLLALSWLVARATARPR